MVASAEILETGDEAAIGTALLQQAGHAARMLGMPVKVTRTFQGGADWLCLYGVGEERRNKARQRQIKNGGKVACWDLGYLGNGKVPGESYLRVSVDHNHPWRDLDRTPADPSRLDRFGVQLRNEARADGPVIVIGMGQKSRAHLGLSAWERETLRRAALRFPSRRVLYRPKPITKRGKKINRDTHIQWPTTSLGDIAEVLKGASLVITRHSNVAVDACIAGIPVECEDGAAFWLYQHGSAPSEERRLDFLRRLAWWQWRTDEQSDAWTFLQTVCA